MDHRMYSLSAAADAADVSVDELRRAIQDGLVAAVLVDSSGDFVIADDELARFVRRTRHADPFGHQKKHKVLILGEDLLFAGTLKMELQRDPRMDARYAAWGKDALLMVRHYEASLFVVDLAPSRAVPDDLFAEIVAARAGSRAAAVAYYSMASEFLDSYPAVKHRLAALAPDAHLSKAQGLRALTLECLRALGLDTFPKIFRLHG
jgi:hypothetical protein